MIRRIAHTTMNYRALVLLLVLFATLCSIYELKNIKFSHSLRGMAPENHPYVKLQDKMEEVFGGSNLVCIALVVKEGDIFNKETLGKIYRVTQNLKDMRGIVPYRILSIACRKLKRVTFTTDPDGTLMLRPQRLENIVADIVNGKQDVSGYKNWILKNDMIYGSLVSKDNKGAVILADFEWLEDYKYISQRIKEITEKETDGNTRFYFGGRPVTMAYVQLYMGKMFMLFLLAVGVMLIFLTCCFRSLRGTLLPLMAGLIVVLYCVGLTGLFKIRLDIMTVTVPFIIFAVTISHAVQVIKRYYEEVGIHSDPKVACEETMVGLLAPAFTGIVADAAGYASLAIFPFRNIQQMGLSTALGMLLIVVVVNFFLPTFLSILPLPKVTKLVQAGQISILDRILKKFALISFGWGRWIIFTVVLILCLLGALGSTKVIVGDTQAGAPEFWPNAKYNRDLKVLNEKFSGTNPYYLFIEGRETGDLWDPRLIADIEGLENYFRKLPEVGNVHSYVDVIKKLSRSFMGNDPEWDRIPTTREMAAQLVESMIAGGDPEDTRSYFELDMRLSNIQIFLRDHESQTIKGIIKKTEDFLAKNKTSDIKITPAAGMVGLFAAIIETIEKYMYWNILQISIIIFIICVILTRSFIGAVIIMIGLLIAKTFTFGVMGFGNIGLFLGTIPVMAPGMGVGVDYSIYILARFMAEIKLTKDPQEAFIKTMVTSGKAVIFTATSVILGLLILCMSGLRLQAQMGGMLSVVLLLNMLAALVVLPSIIFLWKPKFLFGKKGSEVDLNQIEA